MKLRDLTNPSFLDGLLRQPSVNTATVYPWSELVPWMVADLAARNAGNTETPEELLAQARAQSLDPYNNSYVMPLHEFVQHPM
eukprot:gene27749-34260_t